MKKGISLATLLISVFVIMILATSVTITGLDAYNNAKLVKFATELSQVQNLVVSYKEANGGNYPISENIVLDLSLLSDNAKLQFVDEDISITNTVNLHKIDMSLLSKTELSYGNGKKDTDIYALSQDTGKVYYLEGLKVEGEVYYTLTSKLLEKIDYNELGQIDKDGILFNVSETNWTNQSIFATVKIPDNSKYSNISVSLESGNIVLSTIALSSTSNGYQIYNIDNIDENCNIVVNYEKDGANLTQYYEINNIDKVAPTVELVKQETMVNSQNNDKKTYIVINSDDGESGVELVKYEKEFILHDIAKGYFSAYGYKVLENSILVDSLVSQLTIFVQDKAGNIACLDVTIDTVLVDENDYVNDGLLLQYDGINNTGNGHSNTVTVWKDLVGGNDATLSSYHSFSDKGLDCTRVESGATSTISSGPVFGYEPISYTIEVVAKYNSNDTGYLWCLKNTDDTVGLQMVNLYTENNPLFQHFTLYSSSGMSYQIDYNDNINIVFSRVIRYNNKKLSGLENGVNITTMSVTSSNIKNQKLNLGGTDFNDTLSLDGSIYAVRVYNRALTDEEIMKNYKIDKIRFGI